MVQSKIQAPSFQGMVAANGIEVYAERAGQGELLFYIGGTGGDLRNRPNIFDSLLGQRFDILTYDQRGLGRSGKPSGAYAMADYADDAAAVMDHIGIAQAKVMGVSFGGMVAQEFALRHPHKVSALVLSCTSPGGQGGSSFPLHTLEALPAEERIRRHLKISDTRRTDAWIAEHPDTWEALLERSRKARRPDRHVEGAMQQLHARIGHDTFDRLGEIRAPVYLAGGEFDDIAPPRNMRALAKAIPNAELRLYQGGHLFMVQDPAAYPDIARWLEAQLPAR